jgi:hypothetical protein
MPRPIADPHSHIPHAPKKRRPPSPAASPSHTRKRAAALPVRRIARADRPEGLLLLLLMPAGAPDPNWTEPVTWGETAALGRVINILQN